MSAANETPAATPDPGGPSLRRAAATPTGSAPVRRPRRSASEPSRTISAPTFLEPVFPAPAPVPARTRPQTTAPQPSAPELAPEPATEPDPGSEPPASRPSSAMTIEQAPPPAPATGGSSSGGSSDVRQEDPRLIPGQGRRPDGQDASATAGPGADDAALRRPSATGARPSAPGLPVPVSLRDQLPGILVGAVMALLGVIIGWRLARARATTPDHPGRPHRTTAGATAPGRRRGQHPIGRSRGAAGSPMPR